MHHPLGWLHAWYHPSVFPHLLKLSLVSEVPNLRRLCLGACVVGFCRLAEDPAWSEGIIAGPLPSSAASCNARHTYVRKSLGPALGLRRARQGV